MRSLASRLALTGLLLSPLVTPAAFAQDFPPPGYAPLMFNRDPAIHVFRIGGVPWACTADSFCKQLQVEGVTARDLAAATIEPLGFAGRRFHLTFRHANHNKGETVVLGCREDRCTKIDDSVGEAAFLGTYSVRQGDQAVSRAAILRKLGGANARSQILWCAESGCAEVPFTRDKEHRLAFLGTSRHEGRERVWLRDRAGEVTACVQTEVDVTDRLDCERTLLTLGDFPTAAAQPATPQPAPPPPAATNTDADQRVLAAAINQALLADDVARAEPMIADAVRRFPNAMATWAPFQQRLANIKANQARNAKIEEARGLIAEARRLASRGDFAAAERLLQDADRASPNFAETARARTEIAQMRERDQRGNAELRGIIASIDAAITRDQFENADRMLADGRRRYPQHNGWDNVARRIADARREAATRPPGAVPPNRLDPRPGAPVPPPPPQLETRPDPQAVLRARALVIQARIALGRNDLDQAERAVIEAERLDGRSQDVIAVRAELEAAERRAGRQRGGRN